MNMALGLESDTIARETKSFAFQAIGLLAKRLPHLFRDKVDMVIRLFNALKVESPSIRLIVQEATNSLAVAYRLSLPNSNQVALCNCCFFFLYMHYIVYLLLIDHQDAQKTVLNDLESLLLENSQVVQSITR
ncbi:hypothetical protein LXL04_027465 [Taraxacum kok-saghyz]